MNPRKDIKGKTFGVYKVLKCLGSKEDNYGMPRSFWEVVCKHCGYNREIIYKQFITRKHFRCDKCDVRELSKMYKPPSSSINKKVYTDDGYEE